MLQPLCRPEVQLEGLTASVFPAVRVRRAKTSLADLFTLFFRIPRFRYPSGIPAPRSPLCRHVSPRSQERNRSPFAHWA